MKSTASDVGHVIRKIRGRKEKFSKTCKLVGFLDLQVELKMKSAHGIFSFFQKERVRGRNKTNKKKKRKRKFRD